VQDGAIRRATSSLIEARSGEGRLLSASSGPHDLRSAQRLGERRGLRSAFGGVLSLDLASHPPL